MTVDNQVARELPLAPPSGAFRLQRRLAFAAVMIPALGAVAAVTHACVQGGIHRVTLVTFLGMYVLAAVGVEVGLHRLFSHRAFSCGPVVEALLAIAGSIAAQGPVLFWAAIHRRHHTYTDRPGDPHSPHYRGEERLGRLQGLWHAHVGWLFDQEITGFARYVPDLLHNPVVFAVNRLYFVWALAGLLVPALIGGLATGSPLIALEGLLWGGLLRAFLGHHFTWGVNSLCHMFGSAQFAVRDQSRNIALMALVTLGGSWHNNHHAFPRSATTSTRWWQLDFAGLFIRSLSVLRLASDLKQHPGESMRRRALTAVEPAETP